MRPIENPIMLGNGVPRCDFGDVKRGDMDQEVIELIRRALYIEGAIVLDNIGTKEVIEQLREEGQKLIDVCVPDDRILFNGSHDSAYRHAVKLDFLADPEGVKETAPLASAFATGLLKTFQAVLPYMVTAGFMVDYVAVIANMKDRVSIPQYLHTDRNLMGPAMEPDSHSYVFHLPLTADGQLLSLILGSHNHVGTGVRATTEGRLHHHRTEPTSALLHAGHLVHAGCGEKEGKERLRLVVSLSAKQPVKAKEGDDDVILYLIDEKHATAEEVRAADAQAWFIVEKNGRHEAKTYNATGKRRRRKAGAASSASSVPTNSISKKAKSANGSPAAHDSERCTDNNEEEEADAEESEAGAEEAEADAEEEDDDAVAANVAQGNAEQAKAQTAEVAEGSNNTHPAAEVVPDQSGDANAVAGGSGSIWNQASMFAILLMSSKHQWHFLIY